jgi:DNA repair exonuclease SbcCD ATPase subunit
MKKINFLSSENKRDLILKYSGLSIFSDISIYASKKSGELTRQTGVLYNDKCFNQFRSNKVKTESAFRDNDIGVIYKKLNDNKKEHDKKIEEYIIEYEDLEKEYNELSDDKIRCEEKLKTYKLDNIIVTDDLIEEIDDLKKELEDTDLQNLIINDKLSEKQIKELNKKVKKYNNIEEENDDFELIKKKKLDELTIKIDLDKSKLVKTNLKKIEKTKCEKEIKEFKNKIINFEKESEEKNKSILEFTELLDLSKDEQNIINNYKIYRLKELDIELLNRKIEMLSSLEEFYKVKKVDNKKIKKSIETELEELNNELTELSNELTGIEKYNNDYEKYKNMKDINDIMSSHKQCCKEKKTLDDKLDDLNNQLSDYLNYMYNIEIRKNITKLEEEYETINDESFDKYNEYVELTSEINKLEKKMNNNKLVIERIKNNNNKLVNEIKEKELLVEKYNKNKKKYNELNECKKELEKINKKYFKLEKQYNEMKKQKEENDVTDKNHYANYKICLTNYEKYLELKNDKDSYVIINNLLMNNGLIDSILKEEVITKLEEITNKIFKSIKYSPIKIIMKEKKDNKYKVNEIVILNTDGSKVNYYGHFEKNITELVFRLALSQINKFLKTNILIADEPYDGASAKNYDKIEDLISLFKDFYKFNLVISHDERIVKLFNKRIRINKSVDGSHVIQ